MSFIELQKRIHQNAKDKGWWEAANIPEKVCMIHAEISEAVEEYRDGKMDLYFKGVKPEGFGIELADAVIRIMDLCEYVNIDLLEMINTKMEYNKTREYRHGNKKC